MTSYRTCRHCLLQRQHCNRREEVRASIKGLGLTSVTFRCSSRTPLYRAGQRVSVAWPVYSEGWDEGRTLESWPATVIQETEKGFVILVDDVPSDHETPARDYIKNDHLFCNVRPSRLAPLDEPDRSICGHCGNPQGADGSVSGCNAVADGYPASVFSDYWATRCLAQAIEARRAETGTGSVEDESAVPAGDAPNRFHQSSMIGE